MSHWLVSRRVTRCPGLEFTTLQRLVAKSNRLHIAPARQNRQSGRLRRCIHTKGCKRALIHPSCFLGGVNTGCPVPCRLKDDNLNAAVLWAAFTLAIHESAERQTGVTHVKAAT